MRAFVQMRTENAEVSNEYTLRFSVYVCVLGNSLGTFKDSRGWGKIE